jgi:hypothetical protein
MRMTRDDFYEALRCLNRPDMAPKERERAEIAAQVEAFLAAGGKIQQVGRGVSSGSDAPFTGATTLTLEHQRKAGRAAHASMRASGMLSMREAARRARAAGIGITEPEFRQEVFNGRGPESVGHGHRLRFAPSSVDTWVAERKERDAEVDSAIAGAMASLRAREAVEA